MDSAKTSQTATKPFDQFRELTEGLFSVSKQELDAKLADEKAKRQAERELKFRNTERKRQERQQAQK
jgi:hypothetical protein